jgi:hypothetical protein
MALLGAFEILSVLFVVGILSLLVLRTRARNSVPILLLIIAVLIVGLISLSRIVMTLFGVIIILLIVVALFVLISFRRS